MDAVELAGISKVFGATPLHVGGCGTDLPVAAPRLDRFERLLQVDGGPVALEPASTPWAQSHQAVIDRAR